MEEVVADYRNLLWLDLKNIRTWSDFGTTFFSEGLYLGPYSFIEIKVSGKRKTKIQLNDVYHQLSLFPIYNKKIEEIDLSGFSKEKPVICIAETVVGNIGNVRFAKENFDIDKMSFSFSHAHISERLDYKILESAHYDGRPLVFKKPDVLVNGFYALLTV